MRPRGRAARPARHAARMAGELGAECVSGHRGAHGVGRGAGTTHAPVPVRHLPSPCCSGTGERCDGPGTHSLGTMEPWTADTPALGSGVTGDVPRVGVRSGERMGQWAVGMAGASAAGDGLRWRDVLRHQHHDGHLGDVGRTPQQGRPERSGPSRDPISWSTMDRAATPRQHRSARTEPDFSELGRIGAYRQHAMHSARETTSAARAAFMARFEDEVDPERVLDPAERATRASAAMKAHMLRLSLRSRRVRRDRAARGS